MTNRIILTIFFIFLIITTNSNGQISQVYYFSPTEELDEIKLYNHSLLKLALEKSKKEYGEFELHNENNTSVSQRDALKLLKEKKSYM